MIDIEKLEQLLGKITQGPWVAKLDNTRPDWHIVFGVDHPIDVAHIPPWASMAEANAEFIAAAPAAMRWLIDRLLDAETMIHEFERIVTEDQFMDELDSAEFTDAYLRWHGYDPEKMVAELRARLAPIIEAASSKVENSF